MARIESDTTPRDRGRTLRRSRNLRANGRHAEPAGSARRRDDLWRAGACDLVRQWRIPAGALRNSEASPILCALGSTSPRLGCFCWRLRAGSRPYLRNRPSSSRACVGCGIHARDSRLDLGISRVLQGRANRIDCPALHHHSRSGRGHLPPIRGFPGRLLGPRRRVGRRGRSERIPELRRYDGRYCLFIGCSASASQFCVRSANDRGPLLGPARHPSARNLRRALLAFRRAEARADDRYECARRLTPVGGCVKSRDGAADSSGMAVPVEFRIQRSWVALGKWLGFVALAMGLFSLAVPMFDAEVPWWLAVVSGSLGLAGAWWCMRLGYRPRLYSIELSDEGVRLPAENRWAPWSQLTDLAERLVLQRVDILDQTGSRFASLEYQLDGFSEALDRTIAGIRLLSPEQETFRRQVSSGPSLFGIVVGGLMVGFGIWQWFSSGAFSGLLLACIFVGVAGYDAMTEIWSVQLRREGLVIKRGPRTRIIPWNEIAGVELSLRPVGNGSQLLDVFLIHPSGTREHIRPLGSNPFHLKSRISHGLEASRTG